MSGWRQETGVDVCVDLFACAAEFVVLVCVFVHTVCDTGTDAVPCFWQSDKDQKPGSYGTTSEALVSCDWETGCAYLWTSSGASPTGISTIASCITVLER